MRRVYHNLSKGHLGEHTARRALTKLGFKVEDHAVTEPGADIVAARQGTRLVCEVLNWYGGYIHRSRFISIIRNLTEHKAHRVLVTFGVKLLTWQAKLLKAVGAHHIYLPEPNVEELKSKFRVLLHCLLVSVDCLLIPVDCTLNGGFRHGFGGFFSFRRLLDYGDRVLGHGLRWLFKHVKLLGGPPFPGETINGSLEAPFTLWFATLWSKVAPSKPGSS